MYIVPLLCVDGREGRCQIWVGGEGGRESMGTLYFPPTGGRAGQAGGPYEDGICVLDDPTARSAAAGHLKGLGCRR